MAISLSLEQAIVWRIKEMNEKESTLTRKGTEFVRVLDSKEALCAAFLKGDRYAVIGTKRVN